MRKQKRSLWEALLFEQEEAPKESGVDTPDSPLNLREPKVKARPAADSIDDQVDALILRYESASIRKEASLNESLKNLNMRFLFEQEEEPPADDSAGGGEEESDDEEEQDPAKSADMTVSEPAGDQKTPDLDIDKFSTRVVRLVNNYNNLLNIEESIINRAKNFLDENYGEVFVDEFLNSLSQKHGLETQEFDDIPEVSDDNFAVGAFAGGTGGLGGGA